MPVLVFDLETTNRQKGWAGDPSNRIVCASWVGAPGEYGYAEYGDEFEQRSLADRLDEIRHERGILVAHNAKFEAGWVKRMGFDPASFLWWDTLLCEYVMAGNRRWRLDLDSVAQRYGCGPKDPLVDRMMKNGVCPSQIPEGLLLARNRKDVHDTLHIFERQRETLSEALARVLFTRCLSVPVIADIETQGVAVDEAEVDKAIAETEAELRALRDEWATFQTLHLSDSRPLPEWLAGKALSLTNSDHVAWIMYYGLGIEELRDKKGERRRNKATKRWPLGKPLANDKAIQLLALTTDEQRQFIRLRKDLARCSAALTKTLYFFKGVCQLHGGVFYGQFNQAVTQTHRLSSSGRPLTMPDGKLRGVQLQNMPRKYMKLLKAKAGMTASHDGAQLEFRAAVELGDDSAGRENIRLGVDQHKQTAAVLLQKPVTAVTDDERQRAKADCYPLDTEYLTPSGWRRADELRTGDAVMAYDTRTERTVRSVVLEIAAPHINEVVELSTAHNWRLRCTPHHRVYGQRRRDRGTRGRIWEAEWFTAETWTKERRAVCAAPADGGASPMSPDDAARLAWLLTDGCVRWSGAKRNREMGVTGVVVQSKSENFAELRRLFGAPNKGRPDGTRPWQVPAAVVRRLWRAAEWQQGAVGDLQVLVLSLSTAARAAWYSAIVAAEGTVRPGGEIRVAQNAGPMAEAIRLTMFLEGYSPRTTRYNMKYNGREHHQITARTNPWIGGQRLRQKSLGQQLVACIRTPEGTTITRQETDKVLNYHILGNTFKPLYGGRKGTPAQERYYAEFRRWFPGIAATQEGWTEEVLMTGELRLPWGMTFYWPGTKISRSGYIDNTASIYNYPIQSLATAEIMPVAVVYLYHRLRSALPSARIVNMVHDSTVADIPSHSEAPGAWLACGIQAYGADVYDYLRIVYNMEWKTPFGLGTKVGNAKEIKTELPIDTP